MKSENSNIILDIQHLTCGYGGKPIVEDFNLQVTTGEVIAITGPNGCGKSTLLKAIYQLCEIEAGDIQFNGNSLLGKTSEQIKGLGIAYFMQKNAIFSQLTVKENIFLSLNGMSSSDKNSKLNEITVSFPQIDNWMNKTAGLLSGGQRQQLAMAMLLAQNAGLWLLDEPTAGLDEVNSTNFINTVLMARKDSEVNHRLTIIIIEHKIKVVEKLATRIVTF